MKATGFAKLNRYLSQTQRIAMNTSTSSVMRVSGANAEMVTTAGLTPVGELAHGIAVNAAVSLKIWKMTDRPLWDLWHDQKCTGGMTRMPRGVITKAARWTDRLFIRHCPQSNYTRSVGVFLVSLLPPNSIQRYMRRHPLEGIAAQGCSSSLSRQIVTPRPPRTPDALPMPRLRARSLTPPTRRRW